MGAYPQTRVFNPSPLVSGVVPIDVPPLSESPYLLFDLSASNGKVSAAALDYSVEMTFITVLWGGGNSLTLQCPTGWTSPLGLNADVMLPGSNTGVGAWRVLYNVPKKLITLLSSVGGAGSSGGASIPTPQEFTGPGLVHVGNPSGTSFISGPIVEFVDTGLVVFDDFERLTTDIAFTACKLSTGVNGAKIACPNGWTVNGALNTDLILPGSDSAVVGAWLVYTVVSGKRIIVRPAV